MRHIFGASLLALMLCSLASAQAPDKSSLRYSKERSPSPRTRRAETRET